MLPVRPTPAISVQQSKRRTCASCPPLALRLRLAYQSGEEKKQGAIHIRQIAIRCAALALAGFSLPCAAQEIDEIEFELSSVDEVEREQIWHLAANYGEFAIEQMIERGIDPARIVREKCRLGRNQALTERYEASRKTFQAIEESLAEASQALKLRCSVDRAVMLRKTGQIEQAKALLLNVVARLEQQSEADREARAFALTELARILRLEGSYEEAVSLHERAKSLAESGGSRLLPIAFDNRIALIDLALIDGEPGNLVPVVEQLLEDVVDEFGETSFWTAEALARLGGISTAQGDLAKGYRAFSLSSAIKTPDPVGITLDEVRAHFISEEVRLRHLRQQNAAIEGRYSIGYGMVSDWYQVRDQLAIDHADRIDMSTRETSSMLALARYPQSQSEPFLDWFQGIDYTHNISREALIGLTQRIATSGPDKSLPDRFNPLGQLRLSDVVYTHVDALWFDAKEREEANDDS